MELMSFIPIYMDRVWGGRVLELRLRRARLIHVVTGEVTDSESRAKLKKGRNYLQPYVTGTSLSADEPATVLVTDQF